MIKVLADIANNLDADGEYELANEIDSLLKYALVKLSMSLSDAQSLLGVFPGASKGEINKAYKQKAFSTHPDRGGSGDQMAQLNVARDILLGKSRPQRSTKQDDWWDNIKRERRRRREEKEFVEEEERRDEELLSKIRRRYEKMKDRPWADRLKYLRDIAKKYDWDMTRTRDFVGEAILHIEEWIIPGIAEKLLEGAIGEDNMDTLYDSYEYIDTDVGEIFVIIDAAKDMLTRLLIAYMDEDKAIEEVGPVFVERITPRLNEVLMAKEKSEKEVDEHTNIVRHMQTPREDIEEYSERMGEESPRDEILEYPTDPSELENVPGDKGFGSIAHRR